MCTNFKYKNSAIQQKIGSFPRRTNDGHNRHVSIHLVLNFMTFFAAGVVRLGLGGFLKHAHSIVELLRTQMHLINTKVGMIVTHSFV